MSFPSGLNWEVVESLPVSEDIKRQTGDWREHIENYLPTLPPMEELGHYRTVLWTLDWLGGFLRPVQAESALNLETGMTHGETPR